MRRKVNMTWSRRRPNGRIWPLHVSISFSAELEHARGVCPPKSLPREAGGESTLLSNLFLASCAIERHVVDIFAFVKLIHAKGCSRLLEKRFRSALQLSLRGPLQSRSGQPVCCRFLRRFSAVELMDFQLD